MGKKRWKIIRILVLTFVCLPLMAQEKERDDFGIRISAGAEKKLIEKCAVGLEVDFYARNNVSEVDRWGGEMSITYKLIRWLNVSAGYKLFYYHNSAVTIYHTCGSVNKYITAHIDIRHRFNISLMGNFDFGRLNLSLRERWQYIYSPEKNVQQYDEDTETWEDKTSSGKGKNVLRSRFQIKYDIQNSNFQPYANVELYNSWKLTEIRYTVGTDYNFDQQHSVSLYYRYQRKKNVAEPDMHILGIGYKFKI